ncbi:unnamed protein product [Rhodiola kirilowii]
MGGGKKRVKREAGDGVDRISALPAHLKECILECVSVKDAMKTSVLSSNWRYCWTGMRKFNLIDVERDVDVLRRAVDRILLLHSGSIREFKLGIPVTRFGQNIYLSDFFHVLSEKGIQDIEIDGSFNRVLLPSSLFHCRDLKTLRLLDCCILSRPPRVVGFSNLLSLEIIFCTVPSLVLGSLISQFPVLEKLWLSYTHTLNNNQPLVINAHNLRIVFFEDELLGSIIFENVPRLTYVKFSVFETFEAELEMPGSWPSICSLSGIMVLEFDIFSLGPMIGECPSCLPTTLENLKTLTLTSVNACLKDDVRFMFCLIRSSPGLQDLTVLFDNLNTTGMPETDHTGEAAAQKLLETEEREHRKLSNLLTVIFKDIKGLCHEMLLVKIMLSRCPYLKSFKISPHSHNTTKDVRKRIRRELKEFPNKDKLIYRKKLSLTSKVF